MGRQLFAYHPRIGYRFIPGLRARIPHEAGGYLVRINNAGFRSSRDFVPQKPRGTRRILVFGDSQTAGDGVDNEQRYTDLLEQLLPDCEVYNFGLSGTGTDQQYLAYQEYAKDMEHDLLILAVLVENIRRITARYRIYQDEAGQNILYAKPYFERSNGALVLKNVPPPPRPVREAELAAGEKGLVERGGRLPWLRDAIRKKGWKDFFQKMTRYQPFPEYERADSPSWLLMRAILKEWIQNHPRPVLLMPLPFYSYVEETSDASNTQKRFRELADELPCFYYDPLDDLKKHPRKTRREFRFKHDIHLTPAGHQAVAQALAAHLQKIWEK
ncbi:MAG: SGNH/GDSL hydrolase family protein [Deltaproteobacteria bacterium]|nr:SGNH/GDSL hydrolase family protein [Deltaproteobacteria bacterium]